GGLDRLQGPLERRVVLRGKADDDVAGQVELAGERRKPAEICRRGVAAAHRAQDPVVAGLQRYVQMPADDTGVAQRRDQLGRDVAHRDRAEAVALEALMRAAGANKPSQVISGVPAAVAAEVAARAYDLS